MRVLLFLFVFYILSNCESLPSDGFSYSDLFDDKKAIENCMRPVEDTETYWVCKHFKSEVFDPVEKGFGYCTIIRVQGLDGRLHECRKTKPLS